MTVYFTGTTAAALTVAEIIILGLAGYVVFRRWEYTFAESWAYALMAVLMTFSFLFQLSFLSGLSRIFLFVEWALIVWAVIFLWRMRQTLREGLGIALLFLRSHPVLGLVLSSTLIYLTLLAYCIPPGAHHWDLLSRGLLIFGKDAQSSAAVSAASGCIPQAQVPLNVVVLPHHFLRYHTDLGVGLIGLMAYLCIGFSTYALSRRYVWPPTALVIALVVLSMPRFVLLATTPGFEIVPAAVALFCMLAVYRAIESPNMKDLVFLIWGILFSIHAFSVYLSVTAIMLPLFGILLFRRHGFHVWWVGIKKYRWKVAFALIPALIFSQIGLIAWARIACDAWIRNPSALAVVYNPDGIQGSLANMGRYLLQSADFTRPVDWLLNHTTGFSIARALEWLHAVTIQGVFGERGALIPFRITWMADESTCWYGPLGFLLVLPAVLYAVRRAPRRLKAITVALSGYYFLIALVLAWQPDNVRHFDFFFVCGGFCTAFFLTPWRISARGRRGLLIITALLMVYAAAFNNLKPLLGDNALSTQKVKLSRRTDVAQRSSGWRRLLAGSIWLQTRFGADRTVTARDLFGDDRVAQIGRRVPEKAPFWVVAKELAHAYPILLCHRSARFVAAHRYDRERIMLRSAKTAPLFLLFVDLSPPDPVGVMAAETLWQASQGEGRFDGALLRIN